MIATSYDRVLKAIKDKTKGHCNRAVPLCEELKRELLTLRNVATTRTVFAGSGSDDTICADSFRKRTFNKDVEEAKLRSINVHDLRHSYASNYMMSGGNIYDLQLILGHSNAKITMIYAHLSPKHIAEKANVISYNTELFKDRSKIVSINDKKTFGDSCPRVTPHTSPISAIQ